MNRRHFIKSAAVLALAGPMFPKVVAVKEELPVEIARAHVCEWKIMFWKNEDKSGNSHGVFTGPDDHYMIADINRIAGLGYKRIELYLDGIFIGRVHQAWAVKGGVGLGKTPCLTIN